MSVFYSGTAGPQIILHLASPYGAKCARIMHAPYFIYGPIIVSCTSHQVLEKNSTHPIVCPCTNRDRVIIILEFISPTFVSSFAAGHWLDLIGFELSRSGLRHLRRDLAPCPVIRSDAVFTVLRVAPAIHPSIFSFCYDHCVSRSRVKPTV